MQPREIPHLLKSCFSKHIPFWHLYSSHLYYINAMRTWGLFFLIPIQFFLQQLAQIGALQKFPMFWGGIYVQKQLCEHSAIIYANMNNKKITFPLPLIMSRYLSLVFNSLCQASHVSPYFCMFSMWGCRSSCLCLPRNSNTFLGQFTIFSWSLWLPCTYCPVGKFPIFVFFSLSLFPFES